MELKSEPYRNNNLNIFVSFILQNMFINSAQFVSVTHLSLPLSVPVFINSQTKSVFSKYSSNVSIYTTN